MDRGREGLRFVDRVVGIPLVQVAGLLRRKQPKPKEIQSVGVFCGPAIGDIVLLLPILKKIKSEMRITLKLFLGEGSRAMRDFLTFADSVTVVPTTSPLKMVPLLREVSVDVWVDIGQWPRINALYSLLVKSDFRVGFETPGQHRHHGYDLAVHHSKSRHEIENFRELFSWTGLAFTEIPEIEMGVAKKKDLLVIHAFAGGAKPHLKEWPKEYWVEVINKATEMGRSVYLTGSKECAEIAEAIKARCKDRSAIQNVAGIYSLKETVSLLQSAEQVISVNTGIMHLAAAVGTKVTALNGPTSVKRWGPLGKNVNAIQSPRSCSPCLNLGFDFGCPRNDCMREILPGKISP